MTTTQISRPHNANSANWFDIPVTDLGRAAALYESILGITITKAEFQGVAHGFLMKPDAAEPGTRAVSGSLIVDPKRRPSPGVGTIVFLDAPDGVERCLARAVAAGAKVVQPRTAIPPHGEVGLFQDLDGNVIGLHAHVPGGSTDTTSIARPPGHNTVTPGFSVPNAAKVIAFIETAFGGKVVERYDGPDGTVFHAEMRLGDSVVFLGSASPHHPAMPAALSFYVATGAEVDRVYKAALAAGATSTTEPANQFYGYRSATVTDVGGNRWTICAVVEQLTKQDIERRMKDMPKG